MRAWYFLLFVAFQANALNIDDSLKVAIDAFQLKGNVCDKNKLTKFSPLASIGEVIFERPVLSGDKDTACANCHIDNKALADGLSLAIGVGGKGEGSERLASGGAVVPRNAFTVFARGDNRFTTFFWDGKVQRVDNEIYSPIGEGFSMGFDSALSVASVLPLLARDEFLGTSKLYDSNRHVELVENQYYHDKVSAQNIFIQERLKEIDDKDVLKLLNALKNIGMPKEDLTLPTVGNALASFIRKKTQDLCQQSAWEKYILGKTSALSLRQKRGALLFYGKARCASCHSGDLMSDMSFHSIGIPQGLQGPHMFGQDLGRAMVTLDTKDRYKFRTPSLVSVSQTEPYGHNGIFSTLEGVVKYHISPIFYFRNSEVSENMILKNNESFASRSDLLRWIRIDESELKDLIEFLQAL
ncbi:His-Xaa-Ser system-associated MauG-like protein [Photobacterium sp. CCB-ST2H9]|uniref:His-Xaa-Ser system-associated MauG-like protein n=1 Tax=Photobacterium sp. CCB-ST2H9 TaxID=2912855 RepID=UPI002004BCC8|nr:His-Xaa-Ser system-associated MauG-like protein [Photobacterium sp. CCB-ST2H9]UTM59576.1 His-Xaa-Ser system-associated MauG-like protein [Photobacterium sp. CCB-ST2H9]